MKCKMPAAQKNVVEKQLKCYCIKRPHPSPKDLTIPGGTLDKCWNGGKKTNWIVKQD